MIFYILHQKQTGNDERLSNENPGRYITKIHALSYQKVQPQNTANLQTKYHTNKKNCKKIIFQFEFVQNKKQFLKLFTQVSAFDPLTTNSLNIH